jgi:hypothetical protein
MQERLTTIHIYLYLPRPASSVFGPAPEKTVPTRPWSKSRPITISESALPFAPSQRHLIPPLF